MHLRWSLVLPAVLVTIQLGTDLVGASFRWLLPVTSALTLNIVPASRILLTCQNGMLQSAR